jgi:hypothetical protein
MTLPTKLKEAIEQAYTAMLEEEEHALIPFYRAAIYEVILEEARDYQIRGWLDILTAQHVLPLYKQVWPEKDMADKLLELSQAVLLGTLDRNKAEDIFYEMWNLFVELPGLEGSPLSHVKANDALTSAIFSLSWLVKPISTYPKVSLQTADDDWFDPEISDSAMWAAAACSGGTYDTEYCDPTARREFWEWWLHEAIPAAWDLADSPAAPARG